MKIKESKLREIIKEALYREAGKRVVAEGRSEELFGLFGGGKKGKKGNVVTLDNPDKHTGQLQKAFNEIGGAMSGMGAKAIPQLFSNMAKAFAKGGTAPYDENLIAKAMTEFNALKEKGSKRGFDGVEEMLLSLKNKQVGDQSVDKFMNAMLKLT